MLRAEFAALVQQKRREAEAGQKRAGVLKNTCMSVTCPGADLSTRIEH